MRVEGTGPEAEDEEEVVLELLKPVDSMELVELRPVDSIELVELTGVVVMLEELETVAEVVEDTGVVEPDVVEVVVVDDLACVE